MVSVAVGGVMRAFVDFSQEAQKNGLHITAHAGESGPAANVKLVCLCERWGRDALAGLLFHSDSFVSILAGLPWRPCWFVSEADSIALFTTTLCVLFSPSSSQAIEVLGATRIGHGYHCVEDPQVIRLIKEKNIHLEVGG